MITTTLRFLATLACTAAMAAQAASPAGGLRFDSPRVVDLSSPRSNFGAKAQPVPVTALADDDARAIVAAPAAGEGDPLLPYQHDLFGCDADALCRTRAEQRLIDAENGRVTRDGATLVVRPAAGEPARFVDFNIPGTAQADGDSTYHRYLGRVGPARLLHIDVEFGHDAPGAFLVGERTGNVAFVHKGSDVAAFAPDARTMVVLNNLNSPAVVAVASLADDGPALVLVCRPDAAQSRVLVDFKGWRDADRFDLALKRPDDAAKKAAPLPLRLERDSGTWRMAAPAGLDAYDGFACRPIAR